MSSSLIILVLILYSTLLIAMGWLTSRNRTNATFFTGNRQSPWFVVAIGMIGSSLSGVSFISVPGMVPTGAMTYFQMVLGFAVGYIIIATVLLPLYYKLQLTSIYTYLDQRFGKNSYKTGALFFILSRTIGSAARLYIVALILHNNVFSQWGIPFGVTILGILLLIWLYTFRSGIKTVIWTDLFQTLCLLSTLILLTYTVADRLDLSFAGLSHLLQTHEMARIFEFDNWHSTQFFPKQFLGGIFIAIVMTGLDQDNMQKNISCRNLKEAQKNMVCYGLGFVPVNFVFMTLGLLLVLLASAEGVALPQKGDELLPYFVTNGYLGTGGIVLFTIGIISAAFSSADSALTALTTSFCIDILNIGTTESKKGKQTRLAVHLGFTLFFVAIIILFKEINNKSVIDAIYTIASYTYGPLLGLYTFGLFTKMKPDERHTPAICILSPLLAYAIDRLFFALYGYKFGYELLIMNGFITFAGLLVSSMIQNKKQRL